ncbi:MAG: AmmeMemoRadiSam system protein A, partial [Armatimonadetes bacterium RBG_16_58_9]
EYLLNKQAGAFVCLKIDGELRGCIGTIEPSYDSLAEEIVANAISAATRDPRFLPVEPNELPELECSVDVLSPPEPVADKSELDPKVYGVIVESGGGRGLLLPDLEGVDTVDDQVDIARRKAFISPNEPIKLYRFRVIRRH